MTEVEFVEHNPAAQEPASVSQEAKEAELLKQELQKEEAKKAEALAKKKQAEQEVIKKELKRRQELREQIEKAEAELKAFDKTNVKTADPFLNLAQQELRASLVHQKAQAEDAYVKADKPVVKRKIQDAEKPKLQKEAKDITDILGEEDDITITEEDDIEDGVVDYNAVTFDKEIHKKTLTNAYAPLSYNEVLIKAAKFTDKLNKILKKEKNPAGLKLKEGNVELFKPDGKTIKKVKTVDALELLAKNNYELLALRFVFESPQGDLEISYDERQAIKIKFKLDRPIESYEEFKDCFEEDQTWRDLGVLLTSDNHFANLAQEGYTYENARQLFAQGTYEQFKPAEKEETLEQKVKPKDPNCIHEFEKEIHKKTLKNQYAALNPEEVVIKVAVTADKINNVLAQNSEGKSKLKLKNYAIHVTKPDGQTKEDLKDIRALDLLVENEYTVNGATFTFASEETEVVMTYDKDCAEKIQLKLKILKPTKAFKQLKKCFGKSENWHDLGFILTSGKHFSRLAEQGYTYENAKQLFAKGTYEQFKPAVKEQPEPVAQTYQQSQPPKEVPKTADPQIDECVNAGKLFEAARIAAVNGQKQFASELFEIMGCVYEAAIQAEGVGLTERAIRLYEKARALPEANRLRQKQEQPKLVAQSYQPTQLKESPKPAPVLELLYKQPQPSKYCLPSISPVSKREMQFTNSKDNNLKDLESCLTRIYSLDNIFLNKKEILNNKEISEYYGNFHINKSILLFKKNNSDFF